MPSMTPDQFEAAKRAKIGTIHEEEEQFEAEGNRQSELQSTQLVNDFMKHN